MSERIDQLGAAAALRRLQTDEVQDAVQAQGSWRGEAVRASAPDVMTMLANAKEELTFAHSERMEKKTIKERSVEGANRELIDRVRQVSEILEMMPDLDRDGLERFTARLRGMLAREDAFRQAAREEYADPSEAYAALAMAEEEFRRDGDGPRAEAAQAAMRRLLEEEGPAIRAGLNIGRAAHEAAGGDPAAAQQLRDSYRETVFARPGPAGVYKGIIDRFGIEGFAAQLRFLTRAVGDELLAAGPSVEPPRLRELLADLSALRTLDTAHEQAEGLSRRLSRMAGLQVGATPILRQLLPLTEDTTLGAQKLRPIPQTLGLPESRLDLQILFMREARDLLGSLPAGIYRDNEARFALLGSMQQALDQLIEIEETQG